MKKFGIVNLNIESFSGDGTDLMDENFKKIENFAQKSWYGIDFGAQPTNPNIQSIDKNKEIELTTKHLTKLINFAKSLNLKTAIDTFHPEIAEFACKNGIDYINDVNFLRNEEMIPILQQNKDVKYVLMHSLSVPVNREEVMAENKLILEQLILEFQKKISILEDSGIEKSRIILDPGIGFGKNEQQNWEILQNIEKLSVLGCELYIGVSRKRFLSNLTQNIAEKDVASLVITKLLENKVHYSRLH